MKRIWNWLIRFRSIYIRNFVLYSGIQGKSKMDGGDGGRRADISIGFDYVEGPLIIWISLIFVGIEYNGHIEDEDCSYYDRMT